MGNGAYSALIAIRAANEPSQPPPPTTVAVSNTEVLIYWIAPDSGEVLRLRIILSKSGNQMV